jgi:hypothetical protein
MCAGCTLSNDQISAVTASTDSCTAADISHHSSIPLNEAERQLARMNSSEYMHTTSVDEENGVYNYDCSGFVGYTLSRSDPGAHNELLNNKHSEVDLPEADDFYSRFLGFGTAQ